MDEFNAVNAAQEGNVDPQEQTLGAGESMPEGSPEAADQEPAQTPEQNALAARIRRSAETSARDGIIREVFGKQGIGSYADYRKMLEERKTVQQAAAMGMNPDIYRQLTDLKKEVEESRRERENVSQDKILSEDPVRGELYQTWKDQVKGLAKAAHCNYDTAFLLLLERNLGEVLSSRQSRAEQSAVKKLLDNGRSTPGPLGASPAQRPAAVSGMSRADFERLQDAVLRGEIKSL